MQCIYNLGNLVLQAAINDKDSPLDDPRVAESASLLKIAALESEKIAGPSHLVVGNIKMLLGKAYLLSHRYEEAKGTFLNCIDIFSKLQLGTGGKEAFDHYFSCLNLQLQLQAKEVDANGKPTAAAREAKKLLEKDFSSSKTSYKEFLAAAKKPKSQ